MFSWIGDVIYDHTGKLLLFALILLGALVLWSIRADMEHERVNPCVSWHNEHYPIYTKIGNVMVPTGSSTEKVCDARTYLE